MPAIDLQWNLASCMLLRLSWSLREIMQNKVHCRAHSESPEMSVRTNDLSPLICTNPAFACLHLVLLFSIDLNMSLVLSTTLISTPGVTPSWLCPARLPWSYLWFGFSLFLHSWWPHSSPQLTAFCVHISYTVSLCDLTSFLRVAYSKKATPLKKNALPPAKPPITGAKSWGIFLGGATPSSWTSCL